MFSSSEDGAPAPGGRSRSGRSVSASVAAGKDYEVVRARIKHVSVNRPTLENSVCIGRAGGVVATQACMWELTSVCHPVRIEKSINITLGLTLLVAYWSLDWYLF